MATPVAEFESSLKVIVTAKRLSQSKITSLTELALKNMKSDTYLISALYRTHKGLPNASKISSLYVFDALARAAKHQAVKHNFSAKAEKGNPATFMAKLEGILEDLFADLCAAMSSVPELKDKMNKVLDLWSKGSTFPSFQLTKLKGMVNDGTATAQVTTNASNAVIDPRRAANGGTPPFGSVGVPGASSSPPTVGTPTTTNGAPPGGLPPALLALLAKSTSSTPMPAAPTPPIHQALPVSASPPHEAPNGVAGAAPGQYSAAQLALIQQLAIAGGLVTPTPSAAGPSTNTQPHPTMGPNGFGNHQNGAPPYAYPQQHQQRNGPPPPYAQGQGYQSSPRGRDDYYEDDYRDSGSWRGGGEGYERGGRGRGGYGRGRGRGEFGSGGFGRGGWDDGRSADRGSGSWRGGGGGGRGGRGGWSNGRNDDYRDRDYRGQRGSRSRSRSPPPHRDAANRDRDQARVHFSPKSGETEPLLDDFGREIRPSAPGEEDGGDSPPRTRNKPQISAPDPVPAPPAVQSLPPSTSTDAPLPPPTTTTRTRPSRFDQPPPPPPLQTQPIATFENNTVHAPPSQPQPQPQSQSQPRPQLIPIAPGELVPMLYEFDFTAYDFSQPEAWEALGKSYQVTNGCAPAQEELMPIVMMAMMAMQQAQVQAQMMSQQQQQWMAGGAMVDGTMAADGGAAIASVNCVSEAQQVGEGDSASAVAVPGPPDGVPEPEEQNVSQGSDSSMMLEDPPTSASASTAVESSQEQERASATKSKTVHDPRLRQPVASPEEEAAKAAEAKAAKDAADRARVLAAFADSDSDSMSLSPPPSLPDDEAS